MALAAKAHHDDEGLPAIYNPGGTHGIVLICEHASAFVPDVLRGLGLSQKARESHAAWDRGAFETARRLADLLNAKLVHATVSRLVYDCNRPPDAPDAIPERSEVYDIPGNADLSVAETEFRVANYYRPFETLVEQTLAHHNRTPIVVTVHSFTPVYHGQHRPVEIGILHDEDARLADALLDIAEGHDIRRNEPYGPGDGVTHTLQRHALPNGLLNVMIEIRNDLIATDDACAAIADTLAAWLQTASDALVGDEDEAQTREQRA